MEQFSKSDSADCESRPDGSSGGSEGHRVDISSLNTGSAHDGSPKKTDNAASGPNALVQPRSKVMRSCTNSNHIRLFPSAPVTRSECSFYGEQTDCMDCADYKRIAAVSYIESLRPEEVLALKEKVIPPSYNMQGLPVSPSLEDGSRLCSHPLHGTWFPSKASVPLPPSDFHSSASPVCRECVHCNGAMNLRNDMRNQRSAEWKLKEKEEKLLAKTEKKRQKEAAAAAAKAKGTPFLAPATMPTITGSFPAVSPGSVPEPPLKKKKGRPRKYPLADQGSLEYEQPRHAPTPTPPTTQYRIAGMERGEIDREDVKDMRVCVGCGVQYVFFSEFEEGNELWVCNNCVDQILCFGCSAGDASRDHEMIMCDGCMLRGAHYPCLGLTGVPQGKWYCTDCVWKFEEAELGELWVCPSCRHLNHSRWATLASLCMGCHQQRPSEEDKIWKSGHITDDLFGGATVSRATIESWSLAKIASFVFQVAYGANVLLEVNLILETLVFLKWDARAWLQSGNQLMPPVLPEDKKVYAEWIVQSAKMVNAQVPSLTAPSKEPLKNVLQKQMKMRVALGNNSFLSQQFSNAALIDLDEMDEIDEDEPFDGRMEEDEEVTFARRESDALNRIPTNSFDPIICGLPHRLMWNLSHERFAGTIIWYRLNWADTWVPGQLYLLRDVPPEHVQEVTSAREKMGDDVHPVLVLLFTLPSRVFEWAVPESGQIAEFNPDLLDTYVSFASSGSMIRMLKELFFTERVIRFSSFESIVTEPAWGNMSQNRDFVPGCLVFARRVSESSSWLPGVVTSFEDVPIDQVAQVEESRKPDHILVLFFWSPANRFEWVPSTPETIQGFRDNLQQVVRSLRGATGSGSCILQSHLIKRSLMYESVAAPSKREGQRWECVHGCGFRNHPLRSTCSVCGVDSDFNVCPEVTLPEACLNGSRVFKNVKLVMDGVSAEVSSPDMMGVRMVYAFSSISMVVFALNSPRPFIGMLTRHVSLAGFPYHWLLFVLPDPEMSRESGSPWAFVGKLRQLVRKSWGFRRVISVDTVASSNNFGIFKNYNLFNDPCGVAAGTLAMVYANKRALTNDPVPPSLEENK